VGRGRPGIEPFVPLAIAIAAMERVDLVVDGPVDRAWLARLRAELGALLAVVRGFRSPDVRLVTGTSDGVRPGLRRRSRAPAVEPPGDRSLGLCFSNGVDSFHSLTRVEPLGLRLACLININAGAHGRDPRTFRLRATRVAAVARELGVPLVTIDSNAHEVLPLPHHHIHPVRNIPLLGVLRGALAAVAYSSTLPFAELDFRDAPENFIQLGPFPDLLCAVPGLPLVPIGFDAARIEKVRAIAREPLARRHVESCVNAAYQVAAGPDDRPNCGTCFKCVKSLVTLDLLGELDAFAEVLDPAPYRADPAGFQARFRADPGSTGLDIIRRLEARAAAGGGPGVAAG
jgi:hypothetical protein